MASTTSLPGSSNPLTRFLRSQLADQYASLLRQQDLESVVALSMKHRRTKTGPLHEVVEFQVMLGSEKRYIQLGRSKDVFLEDKKTSTFWQSFTNLFALNCGVSDSVVIVTAPTGSAGNRYQTIRSVTFQYPTLLNVIHLSTLAAALSLCSPNYGRFKHNCVWWATSLFDMALDASRTDPSNVVPGDGYRKLASVYKIRILDGDCGLRFFSNNQKFWIFYSTVRFGMRRERFAIDVVKEICCNLEQEWRDLSLDERKRMDKEPRRRVLLLQRLLQE
uniref:Uncharacterized protein n=1 Tax=Moniliophthora roreri TaxID=221103 RepID=A0A0W0EVI0_MONRR